MWGSAGKSETNKILATKMFLKLEILKIKDVFSLLITKFIYKCLNLDTLANFHDWFKLNCDSHTILDLTYCMFVCLCVCVCVCVCLCVCVCVFVF